MIRDLLDREMDRREFLQFVGGAVIALFGVGSVVRYLTTHTSGRQQQEVAQPVKQALRGYGSSPYGV